MAPSDLSILGTAATQLFQSTSHMSTDAVVSVMIALVEVARRALPAFQANPAQPKPAALNRLVEVVLANNARVMVRGPVALRRPAGGPLLGASAARAARRPAPQLARTSSSRSQPHRQPTSPAPSRQLTHSLQPDPQRPPRPAPAPTPCRTCGRCS